MTTWRDYPNTSTPITAATLNSLEARVDGAVSTASRSSAAVTSGLAEQKKELAKKISSDRIRTGTFNVPRIGGNSNLNIDIRFDTPFATANYIVILTVGGSGGLAPEYILASYKTNGLRTYGFAGRVRNTHNSEQGCVVSYIAIQI